MRQSLVTLYRAPVMVILATVMSFIVSPRLAPLLLACIPLLAVVMTILLKVGQPRFKRMLKMMDGMNQAVPGKSGGQPGGEGLRSGRV